MSVQGILPGLVIGAAILFAGCGKKAVVGAAPAARSGGQKQAVEVTGITRQDLSETLTVVGSLESNEAADIRPELSGLVQAIYFEEGQPVKKGDILMKIDDAELRAQFDQVEARFKLADLNVTRSGNLSETRTISQAEFDRARSEFAAARAEMSLLKLRLEKTEVKHLSMASWAPAPSRPAITSPPTPSSRRSTI